MRIPRLGYGAITLSFCTLYGNERLVIFQGKLKVLWKMTKKLIRAAKLVSARLA